MMIHLNKDDRGFLSALSWREYFLLGGLLIIWSLAGFFGLSAISEGDVQSAGIAVLIGLVFTGILLILIAIIDRVF